MAKSAVVPSTVKAEEALVRSNSRLSILSAVSAAVAASRRPAAPVRWGAVDARPRCHRLRPGRVELAEQLYDSLHNKLLPLPDATEVFPAHGAGSACGKNLSTETVSTMGSSG